MADEQESAQKTEEPTQKRLQDAREKGQVANSREINNFFILGTATLVFLAAAPALTGHLARSLTPFLERAGTLPADPQALADSLLRALLDAGLFLSVPLGVMVVAAIGASAVQNTIVVSVEPLRPKLDKISPVAGIKRLFSLKSLVEFLKNLFKITAAGAIAGAVLWPERLPVIVSGRLPLSVAGGYLGDLLLWLLAALSMATALLAGFDLAYQRFDHRQRMRMSRRDIEDEQKQTEGDPKIKQRLRAIRLERSRRRMMAEVPKATVIITNPTHFAVALRYDRDSMPAPEVVAKGVDHLALKIREIAKAHHVPIVENPPLARALHQSVELGQFIPEQHFKAVAEVIGFVMQAVARRGGAS